jgi:endonuclease/exonuclease/phosphatase family metal-dependent hydrolase
MQASPHVDLPLRLLTVNTHKGFSFMNRRFILHELREAVRSISADIVFLQEVLGSHTQHASRHANWPISPQYEFLADTIWTQYAYGRNAVYPWGDHGNALLSVTIVRHQNLTSRWRARERGPLHCVIKVPAQEHGGEPLEVHAVCVQFRLHEAHRKRQTALLCELIRNEVPEDAPLFIAGDFNDWRLPHALPACAGLGSARGPKRPPRTHLPRAGRC